MLNKYRNFIRGISTNWISRIGAALATASFILFFFMEALSFSGILTNAYIGLITYLAFPLLFIIGLLLIPLGWRAYVRKSGKSAKELLAERFNGEAVEGGMFGSKFFQTVGILTIMNLIFIGFVSFRTLHFMDSAHFCGTACHQVMNPEWVTYQQSPHARVQCVDCHVGEGVGALIDSKINGAWQIISLTFDLYEKPIPTPVKNLRPARETCEKCHWPEKFLGDRLDIIFRYSFDEKSSPQYTTLDMKIGSGKEGFESGSHWHVAEKNQVRYLPADESRMKIAWVELKQSDGSFKRFTNELITQLENESKHTVRVMDCVDCHNRATHIYEDPEKALDDRIQRGILSRDPPFLKKKALEILTNNYPDKDTGYRLIETGVRNYYKKNYPQYYADSEAVTDSIVAVLNSIYHRNIHPYMGIRWGSYPNHLGHREGPGCFRCHNPYMKDSDGKEISQDCTLCHSILAFEETKPFDYLFEEHDSGAESLMREYLRDEFVKDFK